MGAKVEVIRGVMHYVCFEIEDTAIEYVYHINKESKYFLQRRAPYPLFAGIYESEEDVIYIIQQDIAQFKNAKNSKKFNEFVGTSKKNQRTLETI